MSLVRTLASAALVGLPLLLASGANTETLTGNDIQIHEGAVVSLAEPVLVGSANVQVRRPIVGSLAPGHSAGASGVQLEGGIVAVPEPSSALLTAVALAALLGLALRRRGTRKRSIEPNRHRVLVVLGLLLLPSVSWSQESVYQGRLTDAAGVPYTGSIVLLRLGIYDDVAPGGTLLFEELHTDVPLSDEGVFSVPLGGGLATYLTYDPSLFTGSDPRYLDVEVNNEPLSPRQRISTAPTALVAFEVDPAAAVQGLVSTAQGTADDALSAANSAQATADAAQVRVSSSCPSGQSIRAINANGTVTCEVDDTPTPSSCVTRQSATVTATDYYTSATATCNAGEIAISGGYATITWNTANDQCHFISNRPEPSATGWRVTLGQPTGYPCSTHQFRAWALCCTAP